VSRSSVRADGEAPSAGAFPRCFGLRRWLIGRGYATKTRDEKLVRKYQSKAVTDFAHGDRFPMDVDAVRESTTCNHWHCPSRAIWAIESGQGRVCRKTTFAFRNGKVAKVVFSARRRGGSSNSDAANAAIDPRRRLASFSLHEDKALGGRFQVMCKRIGLGPRGSIGQTATRRCRRPMESDYQTLWPPARGSGSNRSPKTAFHYDLALGLGTPQWRDGQLGCVHILDDVRNVAYATKVSRRVGMDLRWRTDRLGMTPADYAECAFFRVVSKNGTCFPDRDRPEPILPPAAGCQAVPGRPRA